MYNHIYTLAYRTGEDEEWNEVDCDTYNDMSVSALAMRELARVAQMPLEYQARVDGGMAYAYCSPFFEKEAAC